MKCIRLLWFNRWAGFMLAAVLMASCGIQTPAALPTKVPTAQTGQRLELSPTSGAPDTTIVITGVGFPAQSRIRIRVSSAHSPSSAYIGEVVVGADGRLDLLYVLPSIWPDGSAIDDSTLVFSALTVDDVLLAQSVFTYAALRITPRQATPSPSSGTNATPTVLPETRYTPTYYTNGGTARTPTSAFTAVPTTSATPVQTPAATIPIPATPGPSASTQPASEPIGTSIDFLNSLLHDPSGASSLAYLSLRLRTDIVDNWALPTGLGIQPGYNSFQVVLVSKGGGSALVEATMTYESGASVRVFTLIQEGSNWRIDRIVAGSP